MQGQNYSYADYLAWEGFRRVEIIQGVMIELSPVTRMHQKVCGEIFRQIFNCLIGKNAEVYLAPFAVRPFEKVGDTATLVDTVVEPDIVVISNREMLDDNGYCGAPDLIVEVVSQESQRYDCQTKFNLYAEAGVREYWLMDIHLKVAQSFLLDDGYYVAHAFGSAEDSIQSQVIDCSVDLQKVFE